MIQKKFWTKTIPGNVNLLYVRPLQYFSDNIIFHIHAKCIKLINLRNGRDTDTKALVI